MATVPDPKLRLYLIRHGETAGNKQMRYIGMRDEPLTENGILQAHRAADALSQLPIRIIVSSPMHRTADTAVPIREACGVNLRLDARLREGSFGSWEGLTRSEVLSLGPKDAKLLAQWESDPACAPPGGESLEQVQKRMVDLAEEMKAEFAGASVALVSHVGPIKALVAYALGMPLPASRRLFLDPCTISVVELGAQPLVRLFNSHAHLGWTSARWMV